MQLLGVYHATFQNHLREPLATQLLGQGRCKRSLEENSLKYHPQGRDTARSKI